MNRLRVSLFSIFGISLLAFGSFLTIVFYSEPNLKDQLQIIGFFASTFLWLSGILTLIIFYLRVSLSNREVLYAQLPISIRQAGLVSAGLVGLLAMRTVRVLGLSEAIILVIIVVLLEFLSQSKPDLKALSDFMTKFQP